MRTKAWLAIALAGALSASAAVATTLQRLDLDTMVGNSSVAVIGEVAATQDVVMDGGAYTVATINVSEALWGSTDATLTVNVPGGSEQRGRFLLGTVVPGAPMLVAGMKFVLLLEADDAHGGYRIVGFNQGLIPVAPDQTVSLGGEKGVSATSAARDLRERRVRAFAIGKRDDRGIAN